MYRIIIQNEREEEKADKLVDKILASYKKAKKKPFEYFSEIKFSFISKAKPDFA